MDNQSATPKYIDSNVVQLERQFFGDSENKSQVVELEKILKIAQRYKYLLAILSIIGAIGGYFLSASKVPLYQTSVSIAVEPESSNRAEFLNNRLRYYIPKSFYETQMVVLKSKVVLDKAAAMLSPIMVDRLFVQREKAWYSNYLKDLEKRTKEWLAITGIQLSSDTHSKQGQAFAQTKTVSQISNKLSSSLTVGFGATQQLVTLRSVSSDPLVAAVTANAVADSYVSYLVESRVSQTERAGKWLADRIEESRGRLTDAENALKDFQKNEKLFDLQMVESLSDSEITSASLMLRSARQNYTELSKKYGSKHPQLIEAKKRLALAQSRYGAVSTTDMSSSDDRFELAKRERAINSNRELYELFLSRFNEVELGIDSVSSNTKILERAAVPSVPFSPNVKNETIRGAVMGLFLGVFLLLLREFLDRSFKNQQDVEEKLRLPVLGVLPLLVGGRFKKKLVKLLPERYYHENAKSNFSEVVNHIRTGIIYSNVDNPPKVILVTSALPQEGKTTCATNLSLAFAKLGKTLLIDADFRKPRIAKISNVENTSGLTGYVAGQNSLRECLSQDSESENLYIMKSGEVPPNPLELLSSKRFKNTLELMRTKFDYIVIDSAPIVPVSDGVVLGKLVDAIILIVKAGTTSHHLADTAMKRFGAANLKPVGVVLSQLDYKASYYYYGKYEYYTREYYG